MSKKMKKVNIIVMGILIFNLINTIIFSNVYARNPNISKGYAEYDEEAAQKEAEILAEQQKSINNNISEKKSNDNYIKSLNIEEYELYPKFDKEITEYSLKLNYEVNEISIIAETEDSSATIEGTGKVKLLEEKNKYEINVTAESGTVRTYIINIERVKESKADNKEVAKENINSELIDEKLKISNNNDMKNNILIISLILIIGIMIFIIWIRFKSKNKNK